MSAGRLRELMQTLHDANNHFREQWNKGPHNKSRWEEPAEVTSARNKFWDALNALFSEKLDPLRKSFLADNAGAVDEVIDFLNIDIPAFRCGYEKEWYLGKLKSVPLTREQQDRLKKRCSRLGK